MTNEEKIEALVTICDDAAATGNADLLEAVKFYIDCRQKAVENRRDGYVDGALRYEEAADGECMQRILRFF